jgi:hypothetical protein
MSSTKIIQGVKKRQMEVILWARIFLGDKEVEFIPGEKEAHRWEANFVDSPAGEAC